MNLIRKLKISDIVAVEFTEIEQEIIDLFKNNLSDLIIFVDDSKPDEINYLKSDGTFIIQQDNKSDMLWIRYDGFWEVLYLNYKLNHFDIKILMKYMIERILKQNISVSSIDFVSAILYDRNEF